MPDLISAEHGIFDRHPEHAESRFGRVDSGFRRNDEKWCFATYEGVYLQLTKISKSASGNQIGNNP
jgi:hypothetical protein